MRLSSAVLLFAPALFCAVRGEGQFLIPPDIWYTGVADNSLSWTLGETLEAAWTSTYTLANIYVLWNDTEMWPIAGPIPNTNTYSIPLDSRFAAYESDFALAVYSVDPGTGDQAALPLKSHRFKIAQSGPPSPIIATIIQPVTTQIQPAFTSALSTLTVAGNSVVTIVSALPGSTTVMSTFDLTTTLTASISTTFAAGASVPTVTDVVVKSSNGSDIQDTSGLTGSSDGLSNAAKIGLGVGLGLGLPLVLAAVAFAAWRVGLRSRYARVEPSGNFGISKDPQDLPQYVKHASPTPQMQQRPEELGDGRMPYMAPVEIGTDRPG